MLACQNLQQGDACLSCESCRGFSEFTPAYQEYDSTQVGNVSYVRQLKEHLYYSKADSDYRVIVFDEIHAASSASQNALLKIIEEGPRDVFFVFCTTSVDKVLSTIRSRSVELIFTPVSEVELKEHLKQISVHENMTDNEDVVAAISAFSFGHVRDAVMKLDLYRQIGNKEEFLRVVDLPEGDIITLFEAVATKDKKIFEESLKKLLAHPLAFLRKSFEVFILNLVKSFSGFEPAFFAERYSKLARALDSKVFILMNLFSKDWVYNSFRSDLTLQAFCHYVFVAFQSKEKAHVSERFSK